MSLNERYLENSFIVIFGKDNVENIAIQERLAAIFPDIEDKIFTYTEDEYSEALDEVKNLTSVTLLFCSGSLSDYSIKDVYSNFSQHSILNKVFPSVVVFDHDDNIYHKTIEDFDEKFEIMNTNQFLQSEKYFYEKINSSIKLFERNNQQKLLSNETIEILQSEIYNDFSVKNFVFTKSLIALLRSNVNFTFKESLYIESFVNLYYGRDTIAFRLCHIKDIEESVMAEINGYLKSSELLDRTLNIIKDIKNQNLDSFLSYIDTLEREKPWKLKAPLNSILKFKTEITQLIKNQQEVEENERIAK